MKYTRNSKYKDGKYSFLIYDFSHHSLVDVVPSRKKNHLYSYFEKIDERARNKVHYISMDMYYPYKLVAQKYLKKVLICVDHFHIIKHFNEDLNRLRIRIMKRYTSSSNEYYLLNHFNFLLFNEKINLDNEQRLNRKLNRYMNYRDYLNAILVIDEQLYTAYHLKTRYQL